MKNKVNKIEVNKIEVNKIEVDKVEVDKIEVDKIEVNKIEVNKIEVNKIEVDKIEVDKIEVNKIEYEVYSELETQEIAYRLAKEALPSSIYCLSGDLGTGKTSFSKGFAKGLGINDHITSPTFNIVNEYKTGNLSFFHFDVYRISHEDELYDIGYEEYFYNNGVCLVEWAELVKGLIPSSAIWISISKDLSKGEDYRLILIKNIS